MWFVAIRVTTSDTQVFSVKVIKNAYGYFDPIPFWDKWKHSPKNIFGGVLTVSDNSFN